MIATATITLWAAGAVAEGQPVAGPGGSAATGTEVPASPPVPTVTSAPGTPASPGTGPAIPTQPPQATPSQAAPQGLPTGTPATVLDTQDYEGVLGKAVRSSSGEDMGRIIDIILDKDGRPRAAIIDFGGFLGVGSRKIAVDWRAMRFTSDGKPSRLVLQLSRNQVRVSPEYKPGDPIVVLGPASPAAPEGEQAAAPVPPTTPAAAVPQPAPTAAAPSEKAPVPEKVPDRPAEKTPDK